MDRFEFLSKGWLGALQRTAQGLLDEGAAAPRRPVSYVEVFSGAPAGSAAMATGYVLTFADGKASVVAMDGEDATGDCRVRIDYKVALATMRLRSGPELDALIGTAFADGLMSMSGSPADLPIAMNRLHDALIDQTEVQAA